jgi:hypothetical protein
LIAFVDFHLEGFVGQQVAQQVVVVGLQGVKSGSLNQIGFNQIGLNKIGLFPNEAM